MKLRCEKDLLAEALSIVSRGVNTRGGLSQIFSAVRIEVVADTAYLASTDLDITIQAQAEVQGIEDGIVLIPARLLLDIVRALESGSVSIESADDEAIVSSGRSQFTVRVFPADDFPPLSTPAKGSGVKIPAKAISEALSQVVRAASTDDSKPLLTGVLFAAEESGVRVVATDSYRLAIRDLAGTSVVSEGQQVLVPARALGEFQRLISSASAQDEVEILLGENEVTLLFKEVSVTARLISGEFPNYRQLIPSSYPNQLVVPKSDLLDALKRMKLLIRDNTTPVRLALHDDGVNLSVIMAEVGAAKEDVDAKYTGTEMQVAFNPTYLMEGIEAVGSDDVVIETIDSTKPATIRSVTDEEYRYLLMPVRVS